RASFGSLLVPYTTLFRSDLEDAVARIADRVPRAIWLGWSLGGLVALHAALDRPAQVRGLAMLCATPRFVAAPDWPHAMPAETLRSEEHTSELQSREKLVC